MPWSSQIIFYLLYERSQGGRAKIKNKNLNLRISQRANQPKNFWHYDQVAI